MSPRSTAGRNRLELGASPLNGEWAGGEEARPVGKRVSSCGGVSRRRRRAVGNYIREIVGVGGDCLVVSGGSVLAHWNSGRQR